MRIAVNTRFLLPHKMEGFGWYTYEITKRLVENHPEHEFIFFFDRSFDRKFVFGKNVTPVILPPQARHPILFKIWFDFSITRALKKHKVDVFFSPDGYLSLKTRIPQVGTIHDINFEHHPEDIPKRFIGYLRNYFPKFAKKANSVITVSNYSKQDICSTYNVPQDKVTAIWNGASEVFQPLSDEQKVSAREHHSNGKPYLCFVGALHPRKNLKRLLMAYQDMIENNPEIDHNFVIVGEELFKSGNETIPISEATRSRIHFTGHVPLEKLATIVGGADVFAFVPYFEGFGIPLVEAMRCGTPILSGNKTSLPEVAGDAALYCDPFDVSDISTQLTTLITNENLRRELSEKGLERSKQFSWDSSAEKVWDVIVKAIKS